DERLGRRDERPRTIDERLGSRDERLRTIDERLGRRDERLRTIDEGLGRRDERLRTIDERLDTRDERLRTIDEPLRTIDESFGPPCAGLRGLAVRRRRPSLGGGACCQPESAPGSPMGTWASPLTKTDPPTLTKTDPPCEPGSSSGIRGLFLRDPGS